MKKIPKEVTVRDFRSNLAEHLESARSPKSDIILISPDHKQENVYVIGDKELEVQHARYAKYKNILDMLRALDLTSFRTLSEGSRTKDLEIDNLVTVSEIFSLVIAIIAKAYEEGADAVYNNIDVVSLLNAQKIDDVRLAHLRNIIPKIFDFDTNTITSLSLGLFIKNMREGFDMASLLKVEKDAHVAQTFNQKIKSQGAFQIQIIDSVLKIVQDLLMQPREARITGEAYSTHLSKHIPNLVEWYDTVILGHKGTWTYDGYWTYK